MTMKRETVITGATHPGTKLQVLISGGGWYLGFRDKDGTPYSRETHYFSDLTTAQMVCACFRSTNDPQEFYEEVEP